MSRSGDHDKTKNEGTEDWTDEQSEEKMTEVNRMQQEHCTDWKRSTSFKDEDWSGSSYKSSKRKKTSFNVLDTFCVFKTFDENRHMYQRLLRRVKRLECELEKMNNTLNALLEGNKMKKECPPFECQPSPSCKKCTGVKKEVSFGANTKKGRSSRDSSPCGNEELRKKYKKGQCKFVKYSSSQEICGSSTSLEAGKCYSKDEIRIKQGGICKKITTEVKKDGVCCDIDPCKETKKEKAKCEEKPSKPTYSEGEPYIIKKPVPTPRTKKPKSKKGC